MRKGKNSLKKQFGYRLSKNQCAQDQYDHRGKTFENTKIKKEFKNSTSILGHKIKFNTFDHVKGHKTQSI